MDSVVQDLCYAWRSLRRQPAFAVLAIATLALGIGANAAIFSVVNAVLLRPLAYRIPSASSPSATCGGRPASAAACRAPDFHDWHDTTTSFEAMAYYTGRRDERLGRRRAPTTAPSSRVTPGFFRVFGVGAAIGRVFERSRRAGRRAVHGGHQPRVLDAALRRRTRRDRPRR